MKFSIYNSLIPLTQTSGMLYSGASDKFIIFRKELEPLLKEKSPAKIVEAAPEFYRQLLEGGAIVENDTDETEELIKIATGINNDPSVYKLIINPTMNCNFKCWYCYETHRPGSKMSEETILKVRKFISNNIKGNQELKHISLSFFGGEPLLYYNDTVRPVIDAVREECAKNNIGHHLHFTSNGYLINDRVLEHLKEQDEDKSFQITLDGDREHHNKIRFSTSGSGTYDRIVANIKKLVANKIQVILRINYTKDNAGSIKNIIEEIKDVFSEENRHFLKIDFQKVWQDGEINDDETLLDEALAMAKKEFPYVSNHYNRVDTLRNPCYADLKNEATINFNGDVFKCTARDFLSSNRCGHLSSEGEIIWDDLVFMDKRQCGKFAKQTCRQCRIFPLCGGSCSQNALESLDKESCVRNYGELEKDKIILSRFYNNVVKPRQNESTPVPTA